jgi:hypothetical protein
MREGPEWEKGMEKGLQNQAWGKQERSLECQENEWKYSAVGCWEQKKKKKKKKSGGPWGSPGDDREGKKGPKSSQSSCALRRWTQALEGCQELSIRHAWVSIASDPLGSG